MTHKHSITGNPVGKFEGSRLVGRYWQGGCLCGSGRDGYELHDRRGIYAGIVCSACDKARIASYAPGIMNNDAEYDVDEPVEPEDY